MEDSSRESRSRELGEDGINVQITGKVMVISILVFFLVLAFVFLVQLYARWLWSRIEQQANPPNLQRRRSPGRFFFVSDQEPTVAAAGRGLDPVLLRSLPVLVFNPEDFKQGLECAVCLSELVGGEKARLLSNCNHGFHVDCIDMWFQSHSTCPLCRNPVITKHSDPEPGENSEQPEQTLLPSGFTSDSPIFPTNILFWGNQMQVSSFGACLEEVSSSQPPCSSSSSGSQPEGILAINVSPEIFTVDEEEHNGPAPTRLRSLKRLLSRETRVTPCVTNSMDVEQAAIGEH